MVADNAAGGSGKLFHVFREIRLLEMNGAVRADDFDGIMDVDALNTGNVEPGGLNLLKNNSPLLFDFM